MLANKPSEDSIFRRIYSSSSSEDDEQCVYTYKGAEVGSDLPESFVYLGMNVPNGRDRASACSSPDMDYLEMDFDPGQSNDQDSDSDNTSLTQNAASDGRIAESSHEEANKSNSHNAQNFENDFVTCDENANCYTKKSALNLESNIVEDFGSSKNSPPSHDEIDHERPCCSKDLNSAECLASGQNSYSRSPKVYEARYNVNVLDEEISGYSDSKSDSDCSSRKLSEESDREEITFIPDAFDNVRGPTFDNNYLPNCIVSMSARACNPPLSIDKSPILSVDCCGTSPT